MTEYIIEIRLSCSKYCFSLKNGPWRSAGWLPAQHRAPSQLSLKAPLATLTYAFLQCVVFASVWTLTVYAGYAKLQTVNLLALQ